MQYYHATLTGQIVTTDIKISDSDKNEFSAVNRRSPESALAEFKRRKDLGELPLTRREKQEELTVAINRLSGSDATKARLLSLMLRLTSDYEQEIKELKKTNKKLFERIDDLQSEIDNTSEPI